MRTTKTALAVALFTMMIGCGENKNSVPRCVPGQVSTCPCIGGNDGVQTCGDDGRFGVCQGCDANDMGSDVNIEPDTSLPDVVLGENCQIPNTEGADSSDGGCGVNGPINCGANGTFVQTDTCVEDEVCTSVPVFLNQTQNTVNWTVCAPSQERCVLDSEPSCEEGVQRSCKYPAGLIQWPHPNVSISVEEGFIQSRTCLSDEQCDFGLCVLVGPTCTQENIVCEDETSRLVCLEGFPRFRDLCERGTQCRSGAACNEHAFCIPEDVLLTEPCAPNAPPRVCEGPGQVRICPGSPCWGEDECMCAPFIESCGPNTRCEDGACVPDVDCSLGTRCDGNLLIQCEPTIATYDCSSHGMQCADENGDVGCRLPGDCEFSPENTCAEDQARIEGCCPEFGLFQTSVGDLPCIPGTNLSFDCNARQPPIRYTCSEGDCQF